MLGLPELTVFRETDESNSCNTAGQSDTEQCSRLSKDSRQTKNSTWTLEVM